VGDNSKNKNECPSCAMEIDPASAICPICGYEFAGPSNWVRWLAVALILLAVLLIIFAL
jgi:predicted amidophosphoribosyltransferase